MSWTLKHKVRAIDWTEHSYYENIKVEKGICTVERATSKNLLLRSGQWNLVGSTGVKADPKPKTEKPKAEEKSEPKSDEKSDAKADKKSKSKGKKSSGK